MNNQEEKVGQLALSRLDELKAAIREGLEAWKKAGDIVVDLIDNHSLSLSAISESCEGVTMKALSQFEKIGRNQILPELMAAAYPAAEKARSLPISLQREVIENGVECLILKDGETDTLRVAVSDLTTAQARQVFEKGTVRSLQGQRSYLESAREERAQSVNIAPTPYVVRGKKVIFRQGCELSSHELSTILSRMI